MSQPTRLITNAGADRIADECSDAYSYDNYTRQGWRDCARLLAARGHDAQGIEWVLRSKWMRWAADASHKRYGRNNRDTLRSYLMGSTLEDDLRQMRRDR